MRRNASTRSHIVRTRGQVHDDRDPIVDEDEFIDEELDGMETIGGELSNGGETNIIHYITVLVSEWCEFESRVWSLFVTPCIRLKVQKRYNLDKR